MWVSITGYWCKMQYPTSDTSCSGYGFVPTLSNCMLCSGNYQMKIIWNNYGHQMKDFRSLVRMYSIINLFCEECTMLNWKIRSHTRNHFYSHLFTLYVINLKYTTPHKTPLYTNVTRVVVCHHTPHLLNTLLNSESHICNTKDIKKHSLHTQVFHF